jgi:hypothetical protein
MAHCCIAHPCTVMWQGIQWNGSTLYHTAAYKTFCCVSLTDFTWSHGFLVTGVKMAFIFFYMLVSHLHLTQGMCSLSFTCLAGSPSIELSKCNVKSLLASNLTKESWISRVSFRGYSQDMGITYFVSYFTLSLMITWALWIGMLVFLRAPCWIYVFSLID